MIIMIIMIIMTIMILVIIIIKMRIVIFPAQIVPASAGWGGATRSQMKQYEGLLPLLSLLSRCSGCKKADHITTHASVAHTVK